MTFMPAINRSKKPRYNDRIIKDGFPEGWYIQDRICQDQALLCRKSDFSPFGSLCICTRPRAMSTDDWIVTAQIIAIGFEHENDKRRDTAQQRSLE